MNIILFSPQELNQTLPLRDERSSHILKILHKNVGDSFDAGIIDGKAGTATITSLSDDGLTFSFTPETDGKPLYPLTMIIGFPRPIQLKRLFRDIASLGVSSVHLTGTELGEKSYMQSSLVERGAAYQMLLDGTVQAKSTHVPRLFMHNNLQECLTAINTEICENCSSANNPHTAVGCKSSFVDESATIDVPTQIIKAAPDNVKPECSLSDLLQRTPNVKTIKHIYAAIGSERGWTDKERNLLINNGFILCSMGTRILRTETAATVAATIILNQGLKII